jgi:N-acetylglucosamine kinase-like BadF-type ATPase
MGIDGGGSTLRIAITDENLSIVARYTGSTANPNLIGHDVARDHIQSSITKILREVHLEASNITAVGIGIAGASNLHSEIWLRSVIQPILPDSFVVPSSDLEIALVGALGQRHGILVLSGTGSAVFGVSPSGETLQLGGWGYLLGDEGSGYWIGLQALKRIIQDEDEAYDEFVNCDNSSLNQRILQHLQLTKPRDLIHWLYRSDQPPATHIASLTRLIVDEANNGNWDAINLLQSASHHLANKVDLMVRRLAFDENPQIAFAGGLLENDNRLSHELVQRLELATHPTAQYSPVIGGALLAKLEWTSKNT